MVNSFTNILEKFLNKTALEHSEIEYLKELLVKYPFFKLCETIIFANKNTIQSNNELAIPKFIESENEQNTSSEKTALQQSEQMQIIKKYLDKPFNFYDVLK